MAFFTREAVFKSRVTAAIVAARPDRILDLGCGSGTLLASLASELQEIDMVGLDPDQRILAQAHRKLAGSTQGRVQLCQGSATRLPLSSCSFDFVVSTLVFHHLEQSQKIEALREVTRVLKPGGQLLLADFAAPADLLSRVLFLPVRMLDGWSRTQCNITGKLPQHLRDCGFVGVEETIAINTWLGTIRCYQCHRSST